LDVRITSQYDGDGYHRDNLVYQSRPGFYVTANLYLPLRMPAARIPAILIQHSYHYPKTQGELQDMGMIWARAGCAVLVIERLGFGERVETTPAYRQAHASWFTFSKQLTLVGETHEGWMAWDLIRAVDLLNERSDIDPKRVILLGSVAGGDEPSAVAAALDPRIAAVIPINYDRGHIQGEDEDLFGQIAAQLTTSFIVSSVAPRRYVRAFEFGWEGAEEPDFPDVWVSGWLRARKIWGLYGALENLASSQAYGLIRLSMERISHCWSVGPQQRKELYPILQRWFGIPLPSERDLNMLPDSEISTNPEREAARISELERRRPELELRSISPAVAAQLPRRPLHKIVGQIALRQLQTARARRSTLSPAERRSELRKELAHVLGDIEPATNWRAETLWTRSISTASVEGLALDVEDGIAVPIMLIRPTGTDRRPVVVALAQGGRERFLSDRPAAVAALLRAGIAVCLPDLRGTGETSPDDDRSDLGTQQTLALRELSLDNALVGARLKDLRTVLAYLGRRSDIDKQRIALWGDSFAPPNPRELFVDEIQWEAGPQIQHIAEPLGAHLALLAALYDDQIRAVAALGGLDGYFSVLGHAVAYTPADVIVPRILQVGDIPDIAAALAPHPLLMARCLNGSNVLLDSDELDNALKLAKAGYQESQSANHLTLRSEIPEANVIAWIISHLKS
jgi:cephalosporin-C deacetylase-like acetyl esterase